MNRTPDEHFCIDQTSESINVNITHLGGTRALPMTETTEKNCKKMHGKGNGFVMIVIV